MNYKWRDIKVRIPREILLGWLATYTAREEAKWAEKEGRFQRMLAEHPTLAADLIKAQAEGVNRSTPDLPTDVLRQAHELAGRVRGLEDEVATLRALTIGLQAAVDESVEVSLDVVVAMMPEANPDDHD